MEPWLSTLTTPVASALQECHLYNFLKMIRNIAPMIDIILEGGNLDLENLYTHGACLLLVNDPGYSTFAI